MLRNRYGLCLLGMAVVAAGCGSSTDTGVSSGITSPTVVNSPVQDNNNTVTLRLDFTDTSRALLAANTSLAPTSTFTVSVYQSTSGAPVTELNHVARNPANTPSQDVILTRLPSGNLLMRIVFFDANNNLLGYADLTFNPTGSTLLSVSKLTPGAPPPLGAASPSPTPAATPTPSPSATPAPSPSPSPRPSATASASPSPAPSPSASASPSPTPSASPVGGLTVTPAQSNLNAGGTQTLTVSSGGQTVSNATFSSSKPNVATVSAAGVVTAVGGGNATITASANGQSGQAQVAVAGATLQSLTVTPVSFTLTAPQTAPFSAVGSFSDGTSRDLSSQVTWTGTPGVATVSSTGVVTAVAGGNATITASLGTISASTTGTVNPQVVPPFQPPSQPAPSPSPSVVATVGHLYVSANDPPRQIADFGNFQTADGVVPPTRIIGTGGSNPQGLAIDTLKNLLYASSDSTNFVYVYANASTTLGPPSRSYNLSASTVDVAVDPAIDRLFVATNAGLKRVDAVSTIPTGTTVGSNLASPVRYTGVALDSTRHMLYAYNSFLGQIEQYASYNTSPTFINALPVLANQNIRLWVDSASDRLYVSVPGQNEVDIYANASTSQNLVCVLGGGGTTLTGISNNNGLLVDPVKNELYVTSLGTSQVCVFANASTLTSAVPTRLDVAPVRRIQGQSGPIGIALDRTN